MEKEILIYNPKDTPYGPLSNNYKSLMVVRDKDKRNVWNSVTEFIYSNLLKDKSSIKKVKKGNIPKIFRKLYDREKKKDIERALKIAYETLLEKEGMKKLLTGIKEKKIVYTSKNSFWNKENMIGEILESLRKKIENQAEKEMVISKQNIMREDLYYLYLIAKVLQSNFSKFFTNLHLYRNSNSLIDLVTKFTGKGKEKVYQELSSSSISKARFIDLIKESTNLDEKSRFRKLLLLLVSVNHERNQQRKVDILISGILKLNIGPYIEELRRFRENLIVSEYISYFLNKQASDSTSELYNMSSSELEKYKLKSMRDMNIGKVRQKVLSLYDQKKLPADMLEQMEMALENYKLPSSSERQKIMDFKIPYTEEESKEKILRVGTFVLSGERPYNVKYKSLLPFVEQEDFTIDKLKFPTVMHYVYYYLFKNFLKVEMAPFGLDPYSFIKTGANFGSYKDIKNSFTSKAADILKARKKALAMKGINIKFQKRDLQDLLLATHPYNLVWEDRVDNYLGVGINDLGANTVGKILTEKRKRIQSERKSEHRIENVKPEDVSELVNSNTVIKNWLKLKITDLCKLFNVVNYYYIYNFGEQLEPSKICKKIVSERVLKSKKDSIIKKDTVLSILINTVYTPCSNIYHHKNKVESDPPLWFSTYVKANENFEDADMETVNVLWKHVIVLIFYVIKHSMRSETDIVDVIAKSTYYLQNEDLNLCGDYNFGQNFSTKQKNILLALFNCIQKLQKFEKSILRCIEKEEKFDLYSLLQTAKNLILATPKALERKIEEDIEVLPYCEGEVCEEIREEIGRLPSRDLMDIARLQGEESRENVIRPRLRNKGQSPSMEDIDNYLISPDVDHYAIAMEALGLDMPEEEDDEEPNLEDEDVFSQNELYYVKKYVEENFTELDDLEKDELAAEAVIIMREIEVSKHFKYSRINFFC